MMLVNAEKPVTCPLALMAPAEVTSPVVNKNAADHSQGSGIKHPRMKKITVIIELPVGRDLSLLAYARH